MILNLGLMEILHTKEELTNVSCSLKNTNEYQFDARTGASITTQQLLMFIIKKTLLIEGFFIFYYLFHL
jgi:hypothetical protein